jgi:hypothetical protein
MMDFIPLYSLDTDSDSTADFILTFGSWWYKNEQLSRPVNGETVSVSGKIYDSFNNNSVIVVEYLNGTLWRDLSNGLHCTMIYCPVDSASFISFPSGHIGMGGMWNNRLFGDLNQIPLELMPDRTNNDMILGYHFDFISETGQDMMYGNWSGMGGMGTFGIGGMGFQIEVQQR